MTEPNTDLIAATVTECARRSGLSRSLLYERIATGELPSVCVGRRRLILLSDLEVWLRQHYAGRAAA